MQAVIEAGVIAPLVHLLQTAEFDIKKEAAWAISNATSGGTHEQIKYVILIPVKFLLMFGQNPLFTDIVFWIDHLCW